MVAPRFLTDGEFNACFASPMRNMTGTAKAVVDVWPYVDAIGPLGFALDDVEYVYRDAGERFDQVLIKTDANDLYLVIVIDLESRSIYGHHVLDPLHNYGMIDRPRWPVTPPG